LGKVVVRFEQNVALEAAVGIHAFAPLQANMRVTNSLSVSTPLAIAAINCVETLKVGMPLDLNIALRHYDMALATDAEAHPPVSIARAGLVVQMMVLEWTGFDLLKGIKWLAAEFMHTHGNPDSVGGMLP
jgi:hypothetical protein